MNNMDKVVKKLFTIAQNEYGLDWRCKVRREIWNKQDGFVTAEWRKMNKFFKSRGYSIISCGVFRTVFGYKDLVIKVDNPHMNGNISEVRTYSKMLKTAPLSKYMICPILHKVKVGNSLALVYPKVEVFGNNLIPNRIQQEMLYIQQNMFEDLHEDNIGRFCGGLVSIDFNFGSYYSTEHNKEISDFKRKYKNFWKKYVAQFDGQLKTLKKEYALA